MEPLPYIKRVSHARRSSYAFSHREGYAHLITQGTILRGSPGVNRDMLSDHMSLPDEELDPSSKESPWCHRKMSFLEKKRHQHRGKMSKDMRLASVVSSSTAERPHVAVSTNWRSRSFHEKLPMKQAGLYSPPDSLPTTKERPPSPRESQLPLSESQPLPSGQSSSECQPASLEEKMTFWKMSLLSRKSWPFIGQKEPQPQQEGKAPLPNKTHTPVVETLPPSRGDSSTSQQSMEVEPSPAERQPSPVEWLPVPGGSQVPPILIGQPPLPREEQ